MRDSSALISYSKRILFILDRLRISIALMATVFKFVELIPLYTSDEYPLPMISYVKYSKLEMIFLKVYWLDNLEADVLLIELLIGKWLG